jgi:hypothetical protein
MADKQVKQLEEILRDVARTGCEDKLAGVIAEVLEVEATLAQRIQVAATLHELETLDVSSEEEIAEVLECAKRDILEVFGLAPVAMADATA